MMSKETPANNAAWRLFLVVAVVIAIALGFNAYWNNRPAQTTVVVPSGGSVVETVPGR